MVVTEETKRKQEEACRAGERSEQETEGWCRGAVWKGCYGAGGKRQHPGGVGCKLKCAFGPGIWVELRSTVWGHIVFLVSRAKQDKTGQG